MSYEIKKDFPNELRKFNWGGFWLTWIWGLGNGFYWALLMFIPFIGVILSVPFAFYLGFKGNEIAWNNYKGESVEEFDKTQRKWGIAGLIVVLLTTLFIALPCIFLAKLGFSMIDEINKQTTLPIIERTYNSQNFEPICKAQADKEKCIGAFQKMYDENGKITKLTPIQSHFENVSGYTKIDLQLKGSFEKTKKRHIYLTAKIKQINNTYTLENINFEY